MVLREEAEARQRLFGLVEGGTLEDAHTAGGGLQQASGEVEQRRLAGAAGADERGDTPGGRVSAQSCSAQDRP